MAIAVAELGLLAPCWRWFLSALLICPVVVVCQGQPIAAEKEAASLVQKFAQFDFEGYRLDSEGHQAIWKLTIDDGAPPEFPVVVVTAFRPAAPTKASLASQHHFNLTGNALIADLKTDAAPVVCRWECRPWPEVIGGLPVRNGMRV